jgi:hypothetical protein
MAPPPAELQELIKSAVREAVAQTVSIPREEASAIAAAAARTAVQEAHVKLFAALGYDMANMRDINRLRQNLEFLNGLHSNTVAAATKVMLITITLLAGAALTAIWLGLKAALHK